MGILWVVKFWGGGESQLILLLGKKEKLLLYMSSHRIGIRAEYTRNWPG